MKKENSYIMNNRTRELRLLYYNDYLLEQGIITKREFDALRLAIISKYGRREGGK